MRLRNFLREFGAKPDPVGRAEIVLQQWIPSGHLVQSIGSDMIAILDPAETSTTRHGMYVAYRFDANMRTVTLALGQVLGELADHLEEASALDVLRREATAIRAALRPKDIAAFDTGEGADIVSYTYRLDKLSRESRLVSDLRRIIPLYTRALEAREVVRRQGSQEVLAPARPTRHPVAAQALPVTVKPTAEPAVKPAVVPTVKRAANSAAETVAKPAVEPEAEAVVKPAAEPAVEPRVETDSEPRQPREPKVLIRAMTRRAALASLIAASMAYVAPAAASKDRDAALQTPLEDESTPVFTIDVSQHDWARRGGNLDWVGIRRAGIAGMCARATYGDPAGYNWPTYRFGDLSLGAMEAGMGLRGGYHNIVRGDQASINRQVDWLRQELDTHNANWAMLDVERYDELVDAQMWASWDDVRRFDDRWAAVDSRVLVGYIPPWNWSKFLGQPDLREFRGPVIASNYPLEQANDHFKQLYDRVGGDNGDGWAAYGSRIPEGWQFSARAKVPGGPDICDVNAWRMSTRRLKSLLSTRA